MRYERQTTSTEPQPENQHRLVHLMDRIHAQEVFGNPDSIRAFIDEVDYPQFESYLNRVNGICREIGTNQRKMEGGSYVEENIRGYPIGAYTPPSPGHIRPLMERALHALKTNRDLEQGATMLGLTINAIHPYNDGNGRTSRFAYSLLAHGYDGSSKDQAFYTNLLSNVEGRFLIDLNPRLHGLDSVFNQVECYTIGWRYGYHGPIPSYRYGGYDLNLHGQTREATLLFNDDVSIENRTNLLSITEDYGFDTPLFTEFLLKTGLNVPDYLETYGDGGHYQFQLEKIIPLLSEADIEQMLEDFTELKKTYVEWLIDIFAQPGDQILAKHITELYRPKNSSAK